LQRQQKIEGCHWAAAAFASLLGARGSRMVISV
jgi:hypothetical protein